MSGATANKGKWGRTEFAPTISVIICAYTEARWHDLVAAVASMQSQSLAPHEIIVVIDHNPTLLARVEREIRGVKTLANRFARGLSGARNTGIGVASGEILAFMDEDAVAANNWLAQLAEGYAAPQTLGVGGAIEPLWEGARPAWFPEEFFWVVGCTYRGMPTKRAAVRNLIGCNMSFRCEVFEQNGGFREGVGRIGTRPVGCEETEFCIRLLQQIPDAQMLYDPTALVHHRVPAVRARFSYFLSRCDAEGLSKAQIATFVGAKDSLSNEWGYTLQTLPLGVWHGLTDTFLRLQMGGVARAAAIVTGLAVTTLGYLRGKVLARNTAAHNAQAYESGISL
jgi:glycosyltransferase involved in cell wall biosynthesis